mmetsp:Transcript_7655/g.22787  ORF Transcript_7655/g.22787 Transcript_7655/m.22787 type:complete len:467 (-) Transcript_7655:305-1705(-)
MGRRSAEIRSGVCRNINFQVWQRSLERGEGVSINRRESGQRPRGRRLARPIRQAPSPPNRSPVRKDFGTRLQKPRVRAPPGQQKAKQWLWSGVACGWKRSDTSPKASRHVASSSEKRKAAGGGGGGGGEAAAVEEMKKVRYLVRGLSSTGAQSGLRAGFALMRSSLLAAEDRSLVLVVVSSLKDAAELVREEGALFKRKVRQVVIQGGVLPFSPGVAAAGEMLEPDSAHNNAFDAASSRFFYHRCQELGVPLLVLSRFAAYGCQVPRSTYDDLAATGGQIGRRLQETQRTSIERLWRRACAPADSPSRAGLPVRCDKRWFCDTFLGGDGRDRAEDVSIWDLVRGFNMYDPIALVAAVPALAERFFETDDLVVHGVRHRVVGVSADRSGVRPGSGLQEWLCAAFLEGARLEAAAEEGEEELPRSGSMGRPPWSRAERGAERGDSLDDPSLSPALGEGGQGSDTVHEE